METLTKECSSNLKVFQLDVTDAESIHKTVEFVTKHTAEEGGNITQTLHFRSIVKRSFLISIDLP